MREEPRGWGKGSVGRGVFCWGEGEEGKWIGKVEAMNSSEDFLPLRGVFQAVSAGDEVRKSRTGRVGCWETMLAV